jgi:hypothetical protein
MRDQLACRPCSTSKIRASIGFYTTFLKDVSGNGIHPPGYTFKVEIPKRCGSILYAKANRRRISGMHAGVINPGSIYCLLRAVGHEFNIQEAAIGEGHRSGFIR